MIARKARAKRAVEIRYDADFLIVCDGFSVHMSEDQKER